MNLIQTLRVLATFLTASGASTDWEDELPIDVQDDLCDAGSEYALLTVRRMIDGDDPMRDMLESFRNDFRSMHPFARFCVHVQLNHLVFDLLFYNEWQSTRAPLHVTLETIESEGLLHEYDMYQVVRWLADLLWSGPEAVRNDIDDPELQLRSAETALITAVAAFTAIPDPHHGLDDYLHYC